MKIRQSHMVMERFTLTSLRLSTPIHRVTVHRLLNLCLNRYRHVASAWTAAEIHAVVALAAKIVNRTSHAHQLNSGLKATLECLFKKLSS